LIKLIAQEQSVPLVALEPSVSLLLGYESVQKLGNMLENDEECSILRASNKPWIKAFLKKGDFNSRRLYVERAREFLGGRKMEERDEVLLEKYEWQLRTPESQAALAFLNAVDGHLECSLPAVLCERLRKKASVPVVV
jgi:hypothetical protein